MSSFRQPGPSSTPSYLSYPGSVLPAPPPFIAPREPAPLFDSNESALLSTFLTTLDVDPNFLFNPVLPPGMPSPPPPDRNLTTYGMDARDRWERELREQYGARVEGNGNGAPPAATAAAARTTVRRIPDLPNSEDEDDADAPDDVPVKDEMDDDPDFEPRSRSGGGHSGRGARKKATGGRGGAAATAGGRGSAKKARVSAARQAPPPPQQQDDVDGDVEMADTAASSTPGLTASGRPKRNARPPRRLSGSNGTAAVPANSATPSSSSAPPTSARSAPRPSPNKTSLSSSSSLPALPHDTPGQHHQPLHANAYPPPPPPPHQPQYLQHQYPPHGPSHAGVPLPHGADFMMSGPLSPGLDELPEPPASSYADTQPGAGSSNGPPGRGDAEGSPASSSNATPTGTERGGGGGAGRAAPLTDSQKRSNHILSEQKRRNAIRSGFKDLVDFLVAGEAASGIILGPPGSSSQSLQQQQQQQEAAAAQAQADEEAAANGKKRKGKGTGRGRGRRGDAGANASKSVVLTRAADYILWLERGNRALENEIERLEAAAAAAAAAANGGA